MKPASRRSVLQVRILLRLEQEPVRTVSELADAVGSQRPSVSRSLKTLRTDNLVVRRRNGWHLTQKGEGEARRCKQELSRVADSLQRTYKSVTPAELWSASNVISDSLVSGVLTKNMHSLALVPPVSVFDTFPKIAPQLFSPTLTDSLAQSFAPLANTQHRLFEDLASLANTQQRLFEDLAQSLAPLAETQRTFSGLLADSMALPELGLVVSQNNAMISKAIVDIQAVCSAPSILTQGLDKVLYSGVLRDIQDIGASYRTLLGETAKMGVVGEELSESHRSWGKLLIPSSTIANFTHSLRSEVALEHETESVTLRQFSGWESPNEMLERLLTDLEPNLVDKWQGSWQALRGSNPDRLSQAAFSYRELIRMVLDVLAPNVEVDQSEQSSKRKRQVRQVLEGSEADFAGAMVDGLPNLYNFFSKPAHTFYHNEVAVQASLMAGDGLLLMLLSSRRTSNS